MTTGFTIRTADGDSVQPTIADGALEWVLIEGRTYSVHGPADFRSAQLGERELQRIDARTMQLQIGQWVSGAQTLAIAYGEQRSQGRVRVIPRPEKLDERAWIRMVSELESWLPGVSVGATGGTSGALDRSGTLDASLAAIALLPMVSALEQAVRAIVSAPRERELQIEEHVLLRAVRKADANSLMWLCRHPEASGALDAWRALEHGAAEPRIPQRRMHFDRAHPVNRYVVWALNRAVSTLNGLAARLTKIAARRGSNADDSAWATARARAAQLAAHRLIQLRRRSFLETIEPALPSPGALLSLRDAPTYARFHTIVRPFTSPRFQWDADQHEAGARPTYELYELWTLLALVRQLEARLPTWTVTWRHSTRSVDFTGGVGPGTCVELSSDRGLLSVHFNLRFQSYESPERGHYSLSKERRPDIVIGFSPSAGAKRWMFLDAKYRVSKKAIGDSFESIHIYRDSLRWPSFGGQARAGYLLTPARLAEAEPWFTADFQRRHNCGCLELRPEHHNPALFDQIVRALSLNVLD